MTRGFYGGRLVCESVDAEDQRRIIACVNAARGIPTEQLEARVRGARVLVVGPV